MLTSGNANLLMAHGTPLQQRGVRAERIQRPLVRHDVPERAAGRLQPVGRGHPRACRMAPDFEADPLGPRYRLRGNKMWISAGEHELTENIVHLVLAKIPGPDGRLVPGTRGISLFIVPKKLVDADGRADRRAQRRRAGRAEPQAGLARHDQHAAELRRGHASSPAAAAGCRRLPGRPAGRGPALHVPHDERGAHRCRPGARRCSAWPATRPALDYARQRPRAGRSPAPARTPPQPQVPIIEHADVKRMLLAQKAYAEGALALALYCARLVDELHTGDEARPPKPACCWRC